MFLLFHVQRPDVFAGEDLGLREAIRVLDGVAAPPSIQEAHARAEVWAPYRSVAAVALWDFLRRSRLVKVEG
jgi:DNA-3-methyladenine glycosylase II